MIRKGEKMIQFEKSRPIVIVPYQPRWVDEFQGIGGAIAAGVEGHGRVH